MDLSKWALIIDQIAKDLESGKIKSSEISKEYILKVGNELIQTTDVSPNIEYISKEVEKLKHERFDARFL